MQEKFQQALQKFVDKHKKNKNVIGIFLTGSFIHSKPDKNSDLDVYILTNKSKFRERGNTWINEVEIEYFINPIKQVESYFEEEKAEGAPHTAHMFANSKILYSKGNELKRLIQKAIKIMKIPRKPMSRISRKLSKYQIDDLEKDLEEVYIKKDEFSFSHIAIAILNETLEVFLKIKRLNIEKSKRLENYLKQKDTKFAELYTNALLEKDFNKKYTKLIELIRYIEILLEGKRAKEWELKSKCTYIK